jgi:catechol 2,3-dioxygenase-like lactoylglutathione lyase family enzyme
MVRIEGIDHVALTARDVARSAAWYQAVLGLERRSSGTDSDTSLSECADAEALDRAGVFKGIEAGASGAFTNLLKKASQ